MSPRGFSERLKKGALGDGFFTSVPYLLILAAATVATWYTGILWIAVGVYALTFLLICFTQKTLAGILPIAASFVMCYPVTQNEIKTDIAETVAIGVSFIAVALTAAVVWFIKNRKSVSFGYFPKTPYLMLIAAGLFGGAGAGFFLTPQWFGGLAIGIVCFVVLVMLTSSNRKPLDKELLCKILLMIGLIVVAETFLFYFKAYLDGDLEEAIRSKRLDYGWGVSNAGGMMLLPAMPVLFYYAAKRKFPILEGLAFVALAFAVLMTNSRGAQLSFAVVLVPVLVYSFVKSKHKSGFLCAVLVSATAAVGITLLLLKNESGFIEWWTERGLSDSGRFDIYRSCLTEILSGNFLFGWGFFHSIPGITLNNYLAHDTILQFWADFGLLGLATFVALCVANYRVILKKNGTWGVLMAFALLAPGVYGLIDNSYFTPYYTPMLLVVIAIASNVKEFRDKAEREENAKLQAIKLAEEERKLEEERAEKEIPHIKNF